MSEKKVMKLASRSKRFGAGVIDAVIPFVAYLAFVCILAANGLKYSPYDDFGYGYGFGYGYDFGYNYGSSLSGASAAAIVFISLLLIAYVVVEFVFYAKGKSIGKAILGLQVVSSTNGKPFTFWRMMFREIIVKQASGVLMLGFIWILVDEKNRGWHDKILDSYVVDLKESEKMNLRKKLERNEETADKAEKKETAEKTAAPVEGPAPAPAEKPADNPADKEKDAVTPAAAAADVTAEPKSEAEIEIETITIPEAAAAVEEIAEKAKEEAKKPAVSMAMKKDELLAAAKEAGVKVSSKATKAEIIEAIEKASEE